MATPVKQNRVSPDDYIDSVDTAPVSKPLTDIGDDIPDMPDEYVESPSDIEDITNNTGASVQGALSTDDLDNYTRDSAKSEHVRSLVNAPTGDWVKDDRWMYEKRVYQGNCEHGDLDPVGRTVLQFNGKPKARVVSSIEHQPMLFLRISPDVRYKKDEPNKLDMMTKLFSQAEDLYLSLNGKVWSTLRELRVMLENDDYIVRTMNGDSGAVIVGLKAIRAQR